MAQVFVQFSTGKDSHATLIYAVKKYGKDKVKAVFCDTGWEVALVYAFAKEICDQLGCELITLRSKRYSGFVDMAKQKSRFPSTKARFCTEELKIKPFIDFLLDDVKDNVIILQGIRADESLSRSKMAEQCTLFKYYLQPYKYDKKGKPKYHSYRKKDVLNFIQTFSDDIHRPFFHENAQDTLAYILENGHRPNPLYWMGFKRVGCMPCVNCVLGEVRLMCQKLPEYAQRLIEAENELLAEGKRTNFFPPGYIPTKYCKKKVVKINKKNGKEQLIGCPSAQEVFDYAMRYANQTELVMEESKGSSCMSAYMICE